MVDRPPTAHHTRPHTAPKPVCAVSDPCALEEQVANLQQALHHSRQIGAATGILMARHGWPYEEAFEWLRRVSQSTNRKVSDLAEEIVLTGTVDDRSGAGNSVGSARPHLG